MRQRKIKDLDEKLAGYSGLIVPFPEDCRGRWRGSFEEDGNQNSIQNKNQNQNIGLYLEIGSGKGQFIVSKAAAGEQNLYIGVEGQETVLVKACDKVALSGVDNVRLIGGYIEDVGDYFEEGELDGIYLNFSDPWPKKKHGKRRLTNRMFMERYRNVIKPGGFIEVKTDNQGLFDFTIEEINQLGYNIAEITRDLHRSRYFKEEFMTEYESKFSLEGSKINYLKVVF